MPSRASTRAATALEVMSPLAWEQLDRAIAGAVRIAPDELSERWGELPRERAVIAYCT